MTAEAKLACTGACPRIGIFSAPTDDRFTVHGNGAGDSSYLIETDIFDPLLRVPETRAEVTTVAANELKLASKALYEDGVVVIRDAHNLDPSCVTWTTQTLGALGPHMQLPRTDYPCVRHFDNFNGHAILHSQGRADIWPWAHSSLSIDKFRPMMEAVTTDPALVFKTVGLLTTDIDCPSFGRWHRDVSSLFSMSSEPAENDAANLRALPDYYFSLFFPLTPMSEAPCGGPEFVIGSHRHRICDYADRLPVARPVCGPGDAIIMNGKLIHRGTPNLSNVRRDMLYAVFAPRWFDEEIA